MRKIYFIYVLFALICNTAFAQFKDGGINYEIVSNITMTAQVGSNNELTGDIVIPETVTDGTNTYTVVSLKGWAFAQGEAAVSSITSISLPNTVASISNDAFANNTLLTSVSLGEGLTYIGVGAFYKAGLKSISIPNSVTTIDNVAFFANIALEEINFGSSLTSVGSQAFAYCNPLSSVSSSAITPPSLNANSFEGLVLANINLSVPSESVSTYSSSSNWQGFNIGVLNTNVFEKEYLITVYPNPVFKELRINIPQNIVLKSIKIYDIKGRLILVEDSNKIDVQNLSKGQYFTLIETNKGKSIKRFIKS
ncbi:Por secretion system C-terminal sorting domain-containing protein [Polaribacter sp. KT25b]|uniref:leucine-rich repeat domain-containing protein n=1 Tax=Polaribacter sp. KT25b TaxID=1855336 RepID=UPI00087A08A4|nr:leucine-rich repeat domain-containing protein [Polaribacter sp. KT25b]SDR76778.1 Por secretion system C-terminal sorting domain-containing protein [Polaribacter sp. KT25b]